MKTRYKILIAIGIFILSGAWFRASLQSGGQYSATIKPQGEDTQVFVFVKDSPKFQIVFEKKSTDQPAKIAPENVSAPGWEQTFIDSTLAPGRWTVMFHAVELDFFSNSAYINGEGPFPAGRAIKIRADGKAESAGKLDPVAAFAK